MPVRKRKARSPESGLPLKTAREKADLSQQQLADLIGVKKLTVLRIENGQARPSVDVALALAQVFDATVEALFGGDRK